MAAILTAAMGDLTGRSRLDRARDLSNTAWTLRSETTTSLTANPAKSEETGLLVQKQLTEAAILCREAGADRELAIALRRLGHTEQDAGRIEAAAGRYEEAVAAARRTDDPVLLAHAIRHFGDAHRAARRLAAAQTCYAEALDLYAEHRNPPALDHANALRPMAILKEALGDPHEARDLWKQAKALYAAVPIAAGVAECEENLARLG